MKKSILYKSLLTVILFAFLSCEEILFVQDISTEEIKLVAPMDKANFFTTGVIFSWEKVQEAEKYHLQIAKPDFATPLQIVLDTLVSSTSFNHQLNIGKYVWRVKAINSAYETAYSSRTFTIVNNDDFQSNILTLITPVNELNTNITVQKLSWNPIIGALKYHLQISDTNNVLIKNDTVTETNINFTFTEGNYNWRVRASNGTQQTLFSSRSILVDTTVPNTPTLFSPVDKSTTTDKSISFKWTRTPISGSIEKDSIYIYTDSALTALQLKKETNSPAAATLELGIYYWFVKSFDKAGNVSAKSSVFSFTIN